MPVQAKSRNRQTIQRSLANHGIQVDQADQPVYAYVNHGRWVADCVCNGAELVQRGTRFLCGSCGLESPVVWPDDADDVDRVLEPRPPRNQNWRPGETVGQLTAENIEHGVGRVD